MQRLIWTIVGPHFQWMIHQDDTNQWASVFACGYICVNSGTRSKVMFVLGFLIGFMFASTWERITRRIGHLAYQKGVHFHHSLFGLLVLLFVPLVWDRPDRVLSIIGFGVGIIVQHSIKEGLVFITRS